MHHRSRFDCYIRLLKRSRNFLKQLNLHSDRLIDSGCTRSPEVEQHYRRAKRLISDIEKALKREQRWREKQQPRRGKKGQWW